MATIGAAGLVLYFQYRAIATLESQTQVIVRQISEQAAAEIAGELHRALAGPVLDTLTAVSQPDLRAGRFDLVAQEYKKGTRSVSARRSVPGVEHRDRGRHTGRSVVLRPRRPLRARSRAGPRGVRAGAPARAGAAHLHCGRRASGRASAIKCCCASSGMTRSAWTTSPCSASSSIRRPCRRGYSRSRGARASTRCWPAAPAICRSGLRVIDDRGALDLRQRRRRHHQRPPHLPDAVLSG